MLAGGRAALGIAVLAAPARVTSRWLGEENAAHPIVRDLALSLGARDLALGLAGLATAGDPVQGPRVLAACALVDGADVVATLVSREHLPRRGVLAAVAGAALAAAAGGYLARELARG